MTEQVTEPMKASVNLWELITTVAEDRYSESPNREACKAIKTLHPSCPAFATELELTVTEMGTWIVKVFDHEEPCDYVELTIHGGGYVRVQRQRTTQDVTDTRTISF